MSSSQPSSENRTLRPRGRMYLRAEERQREEAAASQLTAILTPATASPYESSPEDPRDVVEPMTGGVTAASDVEDGNDFTFVAPVTVTPVVAPRPPVDLSAAVAVDTPNAIPPAPVVTRAPEAKAPASSTRPVRRSLRRQYTLMPAAALGAAAMIATLGVALTLSPGERQEDAVPVTEATSAATAAPLAPQATTPRGTAPSVTAPSAKAPAPSPTTPTTAAPSSATPGRPATPQARGAVPASVATTGTPPAAAPVRPREAVTPPARTAATTRASSARARDGQIHVTSIPTGAQVTIDGIGWGQTPVTVPHVPFGKRIIRLTRDGYAAQQAIVQVTGETPARSVDVALQRLN